MEQHPLTVLINIKPDETQALEALLTEIGQHIATNSYIRFPEIERTHFARFVMIGGGSLADRDAQTRLYFSSNYDGDLDAYLDILLAHAALGLDAIFSKCVGYPAFKPGDNQYNASFKAYIKAHTVFTNTFYGGYRPHTVKEIKSFIALRQKIESVLNQPQFEPIFEVLGALPKSLVVKPNFIDRYILPRLLDGMRLGLRPLLTPEISDEPPAGPSHEVNTRPEVTDWLYTVQNEMTVISAIQPDKLEALKRVLWVIDFAARYIYNKGALGGISTIHFARWAIIDDGKNLLFESNYDGNWEQYIGDFVDKANLGMDAIWRSCPGYPKHGARDLQAFKQIIIDHQVRAQAFYSAYPNESVRNIVNDIAISKGLTELLDQPGLAHWLRRL